MKVVQTSSVDIAIRTLNETDREKVGAWLQHLKNWETDTYIQKRSEKLPSSDNVYVLKAGSDIRIFFKLEEDQIEILDIATRETILRSTPVGSSQ